MNIHRLYISIALVSAAIIAFQLVLIQTLSLVQWYHFAYMVISMAMLGFGAAGSLLALFQKKLLTNAGFLLPFLLTLTGISMALVTDVAQLSFARFDSFLLFVEYTHIGKLVVTYGLFFLPFFFGALAIGVLFIQQVSSIGKIYFANLLGSGAGGILALILLSHFFANDVLIMIAVLPILSGLLMLPSRKNYILLLFSSLGIVVVGFKHFYPTKLMLSEYKDLSKTLLLPDARIISEKPSPYGIVQVVSSPVLRYAPGLSLMAQETEPVKRATFLNGNWFGAVTDWSAGDSTMILDYSTAALPYVTSERKSVLVLQAGTGIDVVHAISRRAKKITVVEANPVIISNLEKQYAAFRNSSFIHPQLMFHQLEPRSFLSQDTSHYDLIVLPMLGVFGGSSGISALQEQFILTKEAFLEMWHRLQERGAISITAWMDYPVRNPLKILATMVEVLDDLGIQDPVKHIASVRSWGTISFVLSKNNFSPTQVQGARNFCDSLLFDPAILPQLSPGERTQYNQFQDQQLFHYVDSILSPHRHLFYDEYDFLITPATDDKPYFSQFIRWSRFSRLGQFFGNRSIPFFGIGYLLVIVTFLQVLLASFLLIILPLFKTGFKGRGKTAIFLYFAGIGLGYMFVEMVLIQHFILYFGNAVTAAAAVITCLLIFSGLGSYYSGVIASNKRWIQVIWICIIVILLLYAMGLTFVLQNSVQLQSFFKWLVVIAVVAPPAFCMGIPFPSGLSKVVETNPAMVPWAWGINGCVSVISSVLATILAVELGFTRVMMFAVLGYFLAWVAGMGFTQRR